MGVLDKYLTKEPETKTAVKGVLEPYVQRVKTENKIKSGQPLSRTDMLNFGVTQKTSARDRQVITNNLRRRATDLRPDGTVKGKGFLGELKLPGGGVASEYSVGVQLESRGGEETDIPTLVPTLTQEEHSLMINDIIPNKKPVPDSIIQKAVDHANKRVRAGKDVFVEDESEEVGFFKAFAEKPLEKLPFSPAAAVKTAKVLESTGRLRSFNYAIDEETVKAKYPGALPASRKLLAERGKELQDRDIKIVEDYLLDLEKKYTRPGTVGRIVSAIPAFMIEFMSTGGLQKLGKEGTKRIGRKVLKDYAKTKVGRAALTTGGFAIGTAFRSAGLAPRGIDTILKRMAPKDVEVAKDGSVKIIPSGEGTMTSIVKGSLDHYIEIASEQAGESIPFIKKAIGPHLKKLPFMGKLVSSVQARWLRLNPSKTALDFTKKISSKAGFHGVVGEIGEEYIGDSARAILDVDDFGAGPDATATERLGAAIARDTQMLPEMAVSFAIPGGARQVLLRTLQAKSKREVQKIAKRHDVPVKGLGREAAIKKVYDAVVNKLEVEESIVEGVEAAPGKPIRAIDAAVEPPKPTEAPITAPEVTDEAVRALMEAEELEVIPTEAEGKVETIDRAATRIRSTGEIAIAEKQSLHDETSVAALAKKHNTTKEDIIARINQPKRYQEDERWNMLSDPDLEQGFITSDGRFVTREESAKVQPFKSIIKKGLRKEPDALDIGVEAQPTEAPKKGTVARKELEAKKKRRQPAKPKKAQIEIGEKYGLTEEDVVNRLHKAQLRYEELRSKAAEDLTTSQKKELDFLRRKRGDVQALLGRDIKPLSREAIEARAAQYDIPVQGRTTKAILTEIKQRAIETRQVREKTGWPEWRKGEPINVTPDKLLEFSLRHEAKGARAGYRAGQIDLTASHKELLEFAKSALPAGEYKLIVKAAGMAAKARTPGELKKVAKSVNRMVENYEKASAIQDVKAAIKTAKKAKLRPEFQEALDTLSEEFTLSMPREKTLKRMESLLKAAQREEHEIGDIPQRLIDRAKEILTTFAIDEETGKVISDKPTLKDFKADELRVLSAAIGSIIKENQKKNQFLSGKTQRKREEVLGPKNVKVDLGTINRKLKKGEKLNAKEFILKVWGDKHEMSAATEEKGWLASTLEDYMWIKQIATQGQLSYETLVWILSGENSDAYDILYQNLQDAANKNTDIVQDFRDYMLSKGITQEDLKNSARRGKGHEIKLPKARTEKGKRVPTVLLYNGELLDFNKLVKDPVKRANLLRDKMQGLRLGRQGKKGHSISISKEDLEAIIAATPDDIKAHAEAWHEYINGRSATKYNLKDEAGKEWLKEHGYPLPQREHYSTAERYGEAIEKDIDPMQQFQEQRLRDMNIFKTETSSAAPYVLRNGYARMISQATRMAAYATKATVMNDALSILKDEGFRAQVSQAFKRGDQMLENMEKTLRKYQGMDFTQEGLISKAIKTFAPRMHVGALAAKPYIMLYQPMSMVNALNEIDAKYLLNMTRWRPSQVKRMRVVLNEESPILRARDEASGAQVMNPVQAENNSLRDFFGFGKNRLKGIHRTDSWTISLLGLAAEAEGKAKGLTGKGLREYTARRTEEIVHRTQPTWDPLTISQLAREGRDSGLAHQFIMFSSQRSKNTNTTIREMADYLQKKRLGKKASKSKVAKTIILSQVAQSMAIWGLRAAYFAAWGAAAAAIFGARPKKYDRDWRYYVFGNVGQMLGNWLIVGDVLDMALKKASGTVRPETRARGTVLFETLFKSRKLIGELQQGLSEYAKEEKYIRGPKKDDLKAYYTFSQAIETALMAAGPLTGTPTQSLAIHAQPFLPHRQEAEEEGGGVALGF